MEIYFRYIRESEGLKDACAELARMPAVGFDTETTELDPYKGELRLVQLSSGKNTAVIDLRPFAEKGDIKKMPELEPLRALLSAETPRKVAHNAKFDAKWVRHHIGVEVGGIFD